METMNSDSVAGDNVVLLTDMTSDSLTATDNFTSQTQQSENLIPDLDKSLSLEDDDEAGPLRQIHTKTSGSKYDKNFGNPASPPGVILLGRGNSFSLGRSEVIVLNRRHSRTSWKSADRDSVSSSCSEGGLEINNNKKTLSSQPESPPPVSSSERVPGSPGSSDVMELSVLWSKVESVMFAKQSCVQQVLHDFGIGETAEMEGEEENVWQVLQDNFEV